MYQSREDLRLVLHHPMGFLLEFKHYCIEIDPIPTIIFFCYSFDCSTCSEGSYEGCTRIFVRVGWDLSVNEMKNKKNNWN